MLLTLLIHVLIYSCKERTLNQTNSADTYRNVNIHILFLLMFVHLVTEDYQICLLTLVLFHH